MRYLDPRSDLAFYQVFGKHPELAMSFLNALLPLDPEREIKEIEYFPPDLVPDNPLRKYSIVTVRCRDNQGGQFLVEMQMLWSREFEQRMLLNASKAYVRPIGVSKQYQQLPQSLYSLNLVNGVFEPGLQGYYHYYQMVHVEHTDKVIDGLHLVFVELPKYNPQTYREKKMKVLWLRFLTEIGERTREVPKELLDNPDINKAVTIIEEAAFTDAQLLGYEKFWDIISVEKTLISSYERKGLAAGRAEGEAKGEEKAQHTIAFSMIADGVPFDSISKYTGLSMEEIKNMAESIRP
ncbi:MAG: Rpn family recombination-promoting nuclease/putative transposase [Mediterranea sp.]|jgi:predicted transposase/invertase (TIGR01784 family)|nr:Rpn family recombination-promoting nuclease/putative transposase [Mediterranea sp.]